MRGGSEKEIGRETSSKAKKNIVGSESEKGGMKREESDWKRRGESEIPEEMRKILSNEEAKWEGKAERRDEKLDLQICLDYYEIARLPA